MFRKERPDPEDRAGRVAHALAALNRNMSRALLVRLQAVHRTRNIRQETWRRPQVANLPNRHQRADRQNRRVSRPRPPSPWNRRARHLANRRRRSNIMRLPRNPLNRRVPNHLARRWNHVRSRL
jgi:hypothetical protein